MTNARLVSLYIDVTEVRTFLDAALPLVDAQTPEQLIQRGNRHLSERRYLWAIADFTEALSQKPDVAEANAGRGWGFYYEGDYQTALIDFNEANAATVMPYFGQEYFLSAQATTDLNDPVYIAANQNAKQATGPDGIDALLLANDLDALIAPTGSVAWISDYENGDPGSHSASGPAAVAGYPHLTVPMGLVNNLPAGMSFFASAWQDAEVLALGHAYENLPR